MLAAPQLDELDLWHPTHLPDYMVLLTALTTLHLRLGSAEPTTTLLPPSLSGLQRLSALDIEGSPFETGPDDDKEPVLEGADVLAALPQLRSVAMAGIYLHNLDWLQVGRAAGCCWACQLNMPAAAALCGCCICGRLPLPTLLVATCSPAAIQSLTQVTQLHLDACLPSDGVEEDVQLGRGGRCCFSGAAFQRALQPLVQVRTLWQCLRGPALVLHPAFPRVHCAMQLRHLALYGCLAEPSPPECIAGLTCLTCVWLSSNSLTSLPSGLGRLPQLAELRVADNDLRSLAASLAQSSSLRLLDVSNNPLDGLPPGPYPSLAKLYMEVLLEGG